MVEPDDHGIVSKWNRFGIAFVTTLTFAPGEAYQFDWSHVGNSAAIRPPEGELSLRPAMKLPDEGARRGARIVSSPETGRRLSESAAFFSEGDHEVFQSGIAMESGQWVSS